MIEEKELTQLIKHRTILWGWTKFNEAQKLWTLPNMTTFSGSTPMWLQNCSIASGPSTSGSSAVVYCLNQVRQRLLLKPSSTLFVRLELKQKKKNIEKWSKIESQIDVTCSSLSTTLLNSCIQNWKIKLTSPVHPCNKCNILACQFFKKIKMIQIHVNGERRRNTLTRLYITVYFDTSKTVQLVCFVSQQV